MIEHEQYYRKGGTYELPIEIYNDLIEQIKEAQKERNEYKQLYENALKINQNSHKYITELEDKYVVLQQEKERLREKVNNLEMFKYNTHNDKTKTVSTITKSYKNEYEDHKQRNEKAIEYIKFVINHYKEQLETPIEDTYFDSDVNRKGYILSIIAYLQTTLDTLIGSDKNEC